MIHTGTVESKSEFSEKVLFQRSLKEILSNYYDANEFKVFSESESYKPLDTTQIQKTLDYLYPSGRGNFEEKNRRNRCSIQEYLKHLILLSHGRFDTPEIVLFFYSFLVKFELWKTIPLKATIPIHDAKNKTKAMAWAKIQWKDFQRVLDYDLLAAENRKKNFPRLRS